MHRATTLIAEPSWVQQSWGGRGSNGLSSHKCSAADQRGEREGEGSGEQGRPRGYKQVLYAARGCAFC